VSQPRWVGARRNTKGGKQQGETTAFVLSCAQGGCACSRGLQAFAWEREREREPCASARSPAWPPSRTRALVLPFIDVRRGPRCTMGGCSNVLTCLAERSQSPKYMPSWMSERFWRPVHVMSWPSEERLSPVCKENGPRAIWLNRFWCLMINTTCELMYFPSVCVL
jgi:hypothetical protein